MFNNTLIAYQLFVLLCNFGLLKSYFGFNNVTQIQAVVDQKLVFCNLKLLFLSKDSSGFGDNDIMASVSCWKGLSDGKIQG